MEASLSESKSCMQNMTRTIGDNKDRIGFLESLNKQLEGTVQVKNQQSQEVSLLYTMTEKGRERGQWLNTISQ